MIKISEKDKMILAVAEAIVNCRKVSWIVEGYYCKYHNRPRSYK